MPRNLHGIRCCKQKWECKAHKSNRRTFVCSGRRCNRPEQTLAIRAALGLKAKRTAVSLGEGQLPADTCKQRHKYIHMERLLPMVVQCSSLFHIYVCIVLLLNIKSGAMESDSKVAIDLFYKNASPLHTKGNSTTRR